MISARVLAEEPLCPGYERRCGDPTQVVDHIRVLVAERLNKFLGT